MILISFQTLADFTKTLAKLAFPIPAKQREFPLNSKRRPSVSHDNLSAHLYHDARLIGVIQDPSKRRWQYGGWGLKLRLRVFLQSGEGIGDRYVATLQCRLMVLMFS